MLGANYAFFPSCKSVAGAMSTVINPDFVLFRCPSLTSLAQRTIGIDEAPQSRANGLHVTTEHRVLGAPHCDHKFVEIQPRVCVRRNDNNNNNDDNDDDDK